MFKSHRAPNSPWQRNIAGRTAKNAVVGKSQRANLPSVLEKFHVMRENEARRKLLPCGVNHALLKRFNILVWLPLNLDIIAADRPTDIFRKRRDLGFVAFPREVLRHRNSAFLTL